MFSLSYANCGADFTDTLMNLGMGEAGESQLLRDITDASAVRQKRNCEHYAVGN